MPNQFWKDFAKVGTSESSRNTVQQSNKIGIVTKLEKPVIKPLAPPISLAEAGLEIQYDSDGSARFVINNIGNFEASLGLSLKGSFSSFRVNVKITTKCGKVEDRIITFTTSGSSKKQICSVVIGGGPRELVVQEARQVESELRNQTTPLAESTINRR